MRELMYDALIHVYGILMNPHLVLMLEGTTSSTYVRRHAVLTAILLENHIFNQFEYPHERQFTASLLLWSDYTVDNRFIFGLDQLILLSLYYSKQFVDDVHKADIQDEDYCPKSKNSVQYSISIIYAFLIFRTLVLFTWNTFFNSK